MTGTYSYALTANQMSRTENSSPTGGALEYQSHVQSNSELLLPSSRRYCGQSLDYMADQSVVEMPFPLAIVVHSIWSKVVTLCERYLLVLDIHSTCTRCIESLDEKADTRGAIYRSGIGGIVN
jgi:hypothetical protein